MWEKLKRCALEQVIWGEESLKGKTGAEKKAAIVQRIDDMIPLKPFDGPIIAFVVDAAVAALNGKYGHLWRGARFGEKDLEKLEASMPDEAPEETPEKEADDGGPVGALQS